MNAVSGTRTDGRTARSTRTRDAVVAAFMQLIDAGNLRPTAREVSTAAGVSLRSVFQHFVDLETLFAEAADRQVARVQHMAADVPGNLPFGERLTRFVESRGALLEAVTPVRRAALLQAPFSPEIAGRLKWARDLNREEVERVFRPELTALAPPERELALPALSAATDWYNWETLRTHDGLARAEAQRIMSRTIRALLREEND
ncbi:MAG: TetR/AcrR family transcriptional regulator [Dehalococcoidia bacterium]